VVKALAMASGEGGRVDGREELGCAVLASEGGFVVGGDCVAVSAKRCPRAVVDQRGVAGSTTLEMVAEESACLPITSGKRGTEGLNQSRAFNAQPRLVPPCRFQTGRQRGGSTTEIWHWTLACLALVKGVVPF
jgi:hypothetical protein